MSGGVWVVLGGPEADFGGILGYFGPGGTGPGWADLGSGWGSLWVLPAVIARQPWGLEPSELRETKSRYLSFPKPVHLASGDV